ncbi:MAG: DUF1573 domain-containing protein [Deltaproteobacteria bacterium]|nr:DUF1573 domain-containing protein [Deltaproteobacteria bacterium]
MKALIKLGLSIILTMTLTNFCSAEGPKIQFDRLSHDYGKVFSGKTVSDEFGFRNDGDRILKIEDLTASCGCTKAVEGNKEIPPHGSGKIMVKFDTTGMRAGRKQKTIYVKTNDQVSPVVKLTLYAEVVKELNVEPHSLHTKVLSFMDPIVFPLNIEDTTTKEYKILAASAVEGEAQVSLDPSTVILEPKSVSHLNLLLKLKPEPNRSFYAGKIRLRTNHPNEPEIEIPFLVRLENSK